MLNWNKYQALVLGELGVSLMAFLLLMPLIDDDDLKVVTGLLILTMSGITAIVLRRMTGY